MLLLGVWWKIKKTSCRAIARRVLGKQVKICKQLFGKNGGDQKRSFGSGVLSLAQRKDSVECFKGLYLGGKR
jgi:hypothetical protein